MKGPHAYDCRCEQCRAMAAAIGAQNPDGSYFFTDDELAKLAGVADEDLSCPICLGAGEVCTRCERCPVLCDCGDLQKLLFCAMCQGLGDNGVLDGVEALHADPR